MWTLGVNRPCDNSKRVDRMSEHAMPQSTVVSFLLDRTGSMESIKGETIGGFNAYLDALEREAGDLGGLHASSVRQPVNRHSAQRREPF